MKIPASRGAADISYKNCLKRCAGSGGFALLVTKPILKELPVTKTPEEISEDLKKVGRETLASAEDGLRNRLIEKPLATVVASVLVGILLGKLFL
ncbi:MAG TPA: hypothetical protein VGG10_18005 [Rhizomicrobium sp.]